MSPTPPSLPSLLIVDDDPLILDTLGYLLAVDYEILTASDRFEAIAALRQHGGSIDLALIDLGLPPHPHRADEGLALIGEILSHDPHSKIVVLSGQNEEANARHARTLGALEFVSKPADPTLLREVLGKACELRRSEQAEVAQQPALHRIRGNAPALTDVRERLQQYAKGRFPVLIDGESGSGKEIAAQALHELSPAATEPFVALNCAAISPGLLEATLFGHARGAFTGAVSSQQGYFEEAGSGTLFLDEIGELPLELQPKLLRVLESSEYQRVGETTRRRALARIVAATNRDLRHEVRLGNFRADLYHRLSVLRLTMPPLRTLGHDRNVLREYFTNEYAQQMAVDPFQLDIAAQRTWETYDFPGNVRELRNIVVRLLNRYPGRLVGMRELECELESDSTFDTNPAPESAHALESPSCMVEAKIRDMLLKNGSVSLDAALRRLEHEYIAAALDLARGNMSQAARMLGINRSTLYSRMENLARHGTSVNGQPFTP